MNLQYKKELLIRLGNYMSTDSEEWQLAKRKAFAENNLFIPEFVEKAVKNISENFLQPSALDLLIKKYAIPDENTQPKKVGIVMAGNIPLVGFHDLLCVFITGHYAFIKPSSKDEALIKHFAEKLIEWEPLVKEYIQFSSMLKNCDAYIATGSNNTSRYFEYYFQKYPHIIRKNRTSVAVLTGDETSDELEKLADDVHEYFGLGCRNITKIYVPKNYDFVPLLTAFKKYNFLIDHNKYKNNYDYNLAVHLLNKNFYMTNDSILIIEAASLFSPISQLNFEYYVDEKEVIKKLQGSNEVQCIVSKNNIAFGKAQCPGVTDFADGVDTMEFLLNLSL